MSGRVERWYPLVSGVILTLCYFLFLRKYPLPNSIKDLFSAITNLSGITIGFLGTAQSILFSIDKKYVIQQLKVTGVYNKLINYFMTAIKWSFALGIISIFCLILNFETMDAWHCLLFFAWLFVLTTTALSCYRVIDVFAGILRSQH